MAVNLAWSASIIFCVSAIALGAHCARLGGTTSGGLSLLDGIRLITMVAAYAPLLAGPVLRFRYAAANSLAPGAAGTRRLKRLRGGGSESGKDSTPPSGGLSGLDGCNGIRLIAVLVYAPLLAVPR